MRILHWFRSDLRLDDNTALHHAAREARGEVVPFYTGEPGMHEDGNRAPIRARFALESLADLAAAIERAGSRLALDDGPAVETVVRAARRARADAVTWNDEYEPSLIARDAAVERALTASGVRVLRFHDRLLVPPGAVKTSEGRPFVVYTPFRHACEALPTPAPLPAARRFAAHDLPSGPPAALERGAARCRQTPWPGGAKAARARLRAFTSGALRGYGGGRDVPALGRTSRLSADLAVGTISPRTVAAAVREAMLGDRRLEADGEKFLSELRWRDFYAHVLCNFPHCERGAFRRAYDAIRWRGDPAHFEAWCAGRTGYPIVDAGMRELLATGFMHNRARMIVASFLAKDLLLDWRLGERHFMRQLVDGDLANNNGGWQWAASTGTDAQPYFRIFNPALQGARFDPEGAYVRRWVPELSGVPAKWIHHPWTAPPLVLAESGVTLGGRYPLPIVDHHERRDLALDMYRSVER